MYLEPCNTEGHHNIGHCVGLGEQVGDLLTGLNVPLRHTGIPHLVLSALRQAAALTHRLHDFEGPLGRQTLFN